MKTTFFRVLKSNLKCAFCKEKDCELRYFPERKSVTYCGESRIVKVCKKDKEKHIQQVLSKNLP